MGRLTPAANDCAEASAAPACRQAHRDDIAAARIGRQRLPRDDQPLIVVKYDRDQIAVNLIDHAALAGRLARWSSRRV